MPIIKVNPTFMLFLAMSVFTILSFASKEAFCNEEILLNEEKQNDAQENSDYSNLKDLLLTSQLHQLKYLKNNIRKMMEKEDLDEFEDNEENSLESVKDKKSVILPRIGRSPIVLPRIGAEKKRTIFQPRVGRNYEILEEWDSFDGNDGISNEKRAAFKPRIGK